MDMMEVRIPLVVEVACMEVQAVEYQEMRFKRAVEVPHIYPVIPAA